MEFSLVLSNVWCEPHNLETKTYFVKATFQKICNMLILPVPYHYMCQSGYLPYQWKNLLLSKPAADGRCAIRLTYSYALYVFGLLGSSGIPLLYLSCYAYLLIVSLFRSGMIMCLQLQALADASVAHFRDPDHQPAAAAAARTAPPLARPWSIICVPHAAAHNGCHVAAAGLSTVIALQGLSEVNGQP